MTPPLLNEDAEALARIEEKTRSIGAQIEASLPADLVFCLLLATTYETGFCTFVSNADPRAVIVMLRQTADQLEASLDGKEQADEQG